MHLVLVTFSHSEKQPALHLWNPNTNTQLPATMGADFSAEPLVCVYQPLLLVPGLRIGVRNPKGAAGGSGRSSSIPRAALPVQVAPFSLCRGFPVLEAREEVMRCC